MGKSREKIITARIDEEMYEALRKKAENSNITLSEYLYNLIESSLEEASRIDLLIRNMHEEILQIQDMLTLMQGVNSEVYATLLARTSKPLDVLQRKELMEARLKAEDGIRSYMTRVAAKAEKGDNIWSLENNSEHS